MALPVLHAAVVLALLAAPDPAAIERMVERLGAASWAEREAAAAELLSLGQRAVPALEQGLESGDAEVRHRAALLLERLRWQAPAGLSDALRRAMEHYAALPQDQRSALLARVASELGEDAALVLRQVLRHDPSPAVRREALDRLRRIDAKAAEVELRALGADKATARWAWEQLGHDLYRRGDSVGAIGAYESARQAGSSDERVATSLARLYKRQRHWAKARDLFQQLLAADPGNLDHLRELGQCHYTLGEAAKAEAAWRQMVEAQRGTPQAYLTLARAYNGINERDKELAALREGCKKHPGDYELLHQLARALTREQRFGEAVAALERALDSVGADYQRRAVTIELARVMRMSGQLSAHLRRREAGLAALDIEIAAILRRLAGRRLADGDRAGAREALQQIIRCFPDSASARNAKERLARLGDRPR